MPSPKSNVALAELGRDLRAARLRRRMAAADLALRAGVSLSTIGRLERGDPGVGVGTLADVLVAMGLIKRLGELVDIRQDELGLALTAKHTPRRAAKTRKSKSSGSQTPSRGVDPEGEAF